MPWLDGLIEVVFFCIAGIKLTAKLSMSAHSCVMAEARFMISLTVLWIVMPAWGLVPTLASNTTDGELQEVRIGFLTAAIPDSESIRVIRDGLIGGGAVLLAIDSINNREDLLPNHRLVLSDMYNTGSNELGSIRLLTSQWKEGVVAFFGPDQTCTVEARAAAAWNLPMISYVSIFLFSLLLNIDSNLASDVRNLYLLSESRLLLVRFSP